MHESLIQEIRSKADIVQIIQNYLPLIKKGKNFVGVCPFHDDHDPSMSVSQDKQIFKCFVCGAGGNVFNFVKDFEQIPFPQAILKVAQLANIVVEEQYLERQTVSDAKHKQLFDVLAEYVRYTHYILNTTDGQVARDYLIKRDWMSLSLISLNLVIIWTKIKQHAFYWLRVIPLNIVSKPI